ncbi:CotS family spore coat protein [Clostridium ganghwense]|uniref:CotS family spore coat protein n=1 Tax=Clostridium ganghwense TaxID=312089 RepID=A0ABT4CLG1_9CLOT|nr:CotS family spore coat protein [Clostridium ganghwense]MCY6369885.1 CotS family spore coat protein [Clostridium ganghwense]
MLKNSRFKDKQYLMQYDLNVDIFENYDFKVEDIIPVRKVFIIITDKGNKILKKIDYDIDDLQFINSGIEYIRKNGFTRIFNFEKTKDDRIYVNYNKKIYYVMDLIEGRESEYSNPIDVITASKGLGELHKACEGFSSRNKERYFCGNTLDSFERKLQEMDLFKNIASLSEEKNEFDEIFLNNIEYYKKQMETSIKVLEKSYFYKLCSEEDKKVLCHHDLAHHNILIRDNKAYFVDFDYSIIDLKVHDLCNFISKVEKKVGFDIEKANLIINNYCLFNELDKKELEVLYGMLSFPQDFYTLIKEYYTRTKNWEYGTFLTKLIKKTEFKEDKKEFLEKFKKLIG